MNNNELQIEKSHLKHTLEIIKEILEKENLDLEDLYENFIGDREELWRIAERKSNHIKNLQYAINKPYFARLDFTFDKNGEKKEIYIGKNGISKRSDIIVTDWRAPISSLYYDAEVGKCSFNAPDGTITGNMSLKRQFEIENGKLSEYFDVDLVSNDQLLQKYLNNNNDSRLKSIVATIQKEQNDVIRRNLSDNLIVQGVAGSGKTTVALHRIAYLVYNYINTIRQNQYLVIGPNPVFLKYIKSVLPELDVSGVEQCTFEEFAKEYINEDIKINPSDKKINASIIGKNNTDIDKFKCSLQYKEMIDSFLEVYYYSIVKNPLMLGDFEVLPQYRIQNAFESTKNNYSQSLNDRIEATIEALCRYIENNNDRIKEKYNEYANSIFRTATNEQEQNEMRNNFAKDRQEISKNCRNILRKYFGKYKTNVTKMYKLFISSIKDYNFNNYKNINELKSSTIDKIKADSYDFEDLAALTYIKYKVNPNKDYKSIRHVIVDEAQDFGEFNFLVLKKTLPAATFSIFGDLAQSIYDYRSINNWDEVNDIMFDKKGDIVNFKKSYRTTSEIMSLADDVAESIGLNRSDLVVRHGARVSLTETEKDYDIPRHVAKKIKEFKEKGYKTIAVISKTNLLSNYMNDDLSDLNIYIPNVKVDDDLTNERFSVCTISNQLAKGLEFDAVILNNVSEKIYSSNSFLDMKLLYVAITRALHELDIVYTGQISKPLENYFQKQKKLIH